MSEAKHTPGPWWWYQNTSAGGGEPHWLEDHVLRYHEYGDGSPNCVTLVAGAWPDDVLAIAEGILPTEPNAQLIAAAPDLLAACEATLGWAHTLPPSPGRYAAVDRLSAAIAKARGDA
jgi:hypothetical protein